MKQSNSKDCRSSTYGLASSGSGSLQILFRAVVTRPLNLLKACRVIKNNPVVINADDNSGASAVHSVLDDYEQRTSDSNRNLKFCQRFSTEFRKLLMDEIVPAQNGHDTLNPILARLSLLAAKTEVFGKTESLFGGAVTNHNDLLLIARQHLETFLKEPCTTTAMPADTRELLDFFFHLAPTQEDLDREDVLLWDRLRQANVDQRLFDR